MSLSRWLLKLQSLKLEFVLPVPLLLIAFGLAGEPLTNLLLSRYYGTADKLQADTHNTLTMKLLVNVRVINAEIENKRDFTIVELNTANSILKKLEFKSPVTELSSIKAMIAEELGLSKEVETLQPNTQMQVQLAVKALGILAEIDKEQGFTKVEVKTADSVLKKLEFEFSATELSSVKTMIVQELGLSAEDATMLVSYRVKN
ncbi:hypothetical protein [Brasilonema sp. UFV-L1]|uniref:hypothetical protein n=1 Tax=Brasilonema sp. UFV-L1 TaxID=2234130 RepID=UPI00145C9836|nr:hypothetical protein [Brasilonema sp. UFV-L1]NMG09729.1 hypothetical protein [Brasilonema sp. UFV-L1]